MTGDQPRGPSDLLRAAARRTPDRAALVDGRLRVSWVQLDDLVSDVAAALVRRGLEPGERVALLLPSGLDFVRGYLAVLRAGLVAVPINPAYTPTEVDYIRDDSGAALLLDRAGMDQLLADAAPAPDPDADRGGEQVAALMYTSGTSGRPKGAMLSARALIANLDQVAAVDPPLLRADDVLFVPLPLSHIFGLNAGLGMALRVGATVVLADRFDPAATLATMTTEGVTAVAGVPGQYAAWLRQPGVAGAFAQVRFAMSGSATLGRAVVDGYAALDVPLHDGYGLTEAAPVVTVTASGAPPARAGSIGRPLPGVEVQLRDRDGAPLDDDDGPGRIFVHGANLFSGYWPDGAGGPDRDGWFGTGDIAVRDEDGALRLVGRTADTVIVNGFTVYPAEIEAVLANDPRVAEVAVVGAPDERTGEAVVAYVVAALGTALSPAELIASAGERLARFKVPSVVEVVTSLPHTVTGKIMKWQLAGKNRED
jgi:long-chain acyl-CoA synthetase